MSKKAQFTYERVNVSPSYLAGIREEFTSVEYQPKILYKNTCRYKNLRTIFDTEDGKLYHESWNPVKIEQNSDDSYFTVTKYEEGRLDILANKYYGSARYWWIIAMANNIIDPFDVPNGTVLRIPQMVALYRAGGVLSG